MYTADELPADLIDISTSIRLPSAELRPFLASSNVQEILD